MYVYIHAGMYTCIYTYTHTPYIEATHCSVRPRITTHCSSCSRTYEAPDGGMDPYSSPYKISNASPNKPSPHSLLRTRQKLCSQESLSKPVHFKP